MRGDRVEQKGIAVRMYSLNQKRLDEALQASMDFILEMASAGKLADIMRQIETRLIALKEDKMIISCPECKVDNFYFDGAYIVCRNPECPMYKVKIWGRIPDDWKGEADDSQD